MKKIYALFLFVFVSIAAYSQCFVQYSNTPCTCFGLCNGTATATAVGGTPPYVYSWNNGQTTATATGLCAGSYNCMVVDALGNICASTSGANVTQPTQIFVNSTGQNPTSCILCDGMVTGTASGGTPPFTYMWMPGNCAQQTCTGLCAGIYTLTVTDANGCTATSTVTLTCPTGVEENNSTFNVSVYPNPAKDFITVNIDEKATIEIYNVVGEVLTRLSIKNGNTAINVSELPSGIYFIKIETTSATQTKKLIKQ